MAGIFTTQNFGIGPGSNVVVHDSEQPPGVDNDNDRVSTTSTTEPEFGPPFSTWENNESNNVIVPISVLKSLVQENCRRKRTDLFHSLCSNYLLEDERNSQLPDVAVRKIFQYITYPRSTILACRLVCTQWNRVIENTCALMRRITFPIWHPKQFLELESVKTGKVRSISFPNCSPLEQKYTSDFTNAISNTNLIEEVSFAFEDSNSQQQSELFVLILEKCRHLEKLGIDTRHSCFFRDFKGLEFNFASANQIKNVCISCLSEFTLEDGEGFTKLILQLPKLEKLTLDGSCNFSAQNKTYLDGICEYLVKYEKVLQLKKVSCIGLCADDDWEDHEALIRLIILCEKYGVAFSDYDPTFNFGQLLSIVDLPFQERPLFSAAVEGRIYFNNELDEFSQANFDRFYGLNITFLDIIFQRNITNGELNWIKEVRGLEDLQLGSYQNLPTKPSFRLTQDSLEEINNVFSTGLNSVKNFGVRYFDNIQIFRWSEYFPNLQSLDIRDCKILPNDLIYQLTSLESLSDLNLCHLSNLSDDMFTAECINRFPGSDNDGGKKCLIPAIACFKSLHYLYIYSCPLLTDNFIINGISKSKTLKKLKALDCANVTKECLENSVKCKVQIHVN